MEEIINFRSASSFLPKESCISAIVPIPPNNPCEHQKHSNFAAGGFSLAIRVDLFRKFAARRFMFGDWAMFLWVKAEACQLHVTQDVSARWTNTVQDKHGVFTAGAGIHKMGDEN